MTDLWTTLEENINELNSILNQLEIEYTRKNRLEAKGEAKKDFTTLRYDICIKKIKSLEAIHDNFIKALKKENFID